MKIHTFVHKMNSGWDTELLRELDSENTLVLAFASPSYSETEQPFKDLLDTYPDSHIIGCSTAGEFLGYNLQDDSIVVAVVRFEHTGLRSAQAKVSSSTDSYAAAKSISEALATDDLKAVFVLSDGLNVNGSELVRGFNDVLPKDKVVTGGLAGDGPRFAKTFVIQNSGPVSGIVAAVGFYGDAIHVGHGSKGGWDKFGHERVITRSQGNVLYELDGKPALDVYKEYLGDKVSELPASALLFPLSIRTSTDDKDTLVRTILAIDEKENSMTFAGDVPEGCLAQFLYANFDRIIGGALDATNSARGEAKDSMLAIGISCVGRRLVLSERTDEEIEACHDVLPSDSKLIGFYSYGEISPYTDSNCSLHNQSMTMTTFYEAA